MERLRRKRANSNPNPDYASVSPGHEMFRTHPKPASNCSSNGILDGDDDLLTFELELRSRRPTPMKKLLAKEMCRESDSKRRSSSPGVVAKLMGLDALPPPPQHHHNHHSPCDSVRRQKQLSFKDVYEVPASEHDMAFIRQKFTDAKRLAHDESSKEFRDALHVLDSNRHLLLRYLHPDPPSAAPQRRPRPRPPPRHHCCRQPQPTRIVVLKPNLGKILRAGDGVPSRKDRDVPLVRKREIEVCGKRSASRELAKEITQQMRLSASSSSAFKGYAADDSSMSGNESPPQLFAPTIHTRQRSSRSHSSAESSMSREGKKRLSERWKLNHNHHSRNSSESSEIRAMSSRGSTLADMLAVSEDKEAKRTAREQPLGISSRDGWKDAAKLTRSRSLPSSSPVFGSPKAGEDRFVSLKERKKSRPRSNSATSFPCPYVITQRQSDDTCPKIFQSLSGNVTDTSPIEKTPTLTTMDVEPDTATIDEQNSPNPLQELPNEDREESPVPMDRSVPASESKESDQPSPVSVLAAPFSDDPSSSPDCFESLSADLQGLRMQLQLLKLESESYEEGDMVLSSDGDNEERSPSMMCKPQQSWETSYAVNALVHSTLDDDDPDAFLVSWHARECPIGPHVFEALEKEDDYKHLPRCERKLLFDRINEAIVVMHEQSRLDPNELQEHLIRFLSGSEEAKKEIAERVQSQWLDVREDVETIAANIQKSLYDELVAELLDSAY